jgi:hypothetical protein
MTNVRMRATDQLHVSTVKADSLLPGEEFEVSSGLAEDLEKRGLPVERIGEKAEPAPENKKAPAPTNKAAKASKRKGK